MAHDVVINITYRAPRKEGENGKTLVNASGNPSPALQAGHSFYPKPAYLNVSMGFNNRINGFSDEFLYAVECGYTFGNGFTAILRVRGLESLENGDDAVGGGMGGLYANDQSFVTYGPELIYNLGNGAGVSLSAANSARARNALQAPVYSAGFFIKR